MFLLPFYAHIRWTKKGVLIMRVEDGAGQGVIRMKNLEREMERKGWKVMNEWKEDRNYYVELKR